MFTVFGLRFSESSLFFMYPSEFTFQVYIQIAVRENLSPQVHYSRLYLDVRVGERSNKRERKGERGDEERRKGESKIIIRLNELHHRRLSRS